MNRLIDLSIVVIVILLLLLSADGARLSGECVSLCNDLRYEVMTLEMCREAKKTLPRPKIGDFCVRAMEQGFSDSCIALCMDERPVSRVAQSCRAAAVEMPRPTVRKWCEHGYTVSFQTTIEQLRFHFKTPETTTPTEATTTTTVDSGRSLEEEKTTVSEPDPEPVVDTRPILATVPVTLDDVARDLLVHVGENAEDAVVSFCREFLPSDVSSCIRQLLPVVLEKLEELPLAV